jgi:hypothetical protein
MNDFVAMMHFAGSRIFTGDEYLIFCIKPTAHRLLHKIILDRSSILASPGGGIFYVILCTGLQGKRIIIYASRSAR